MKPITKILVPTDFSENAQLAYRHAQEIAHRVGAKVDFIHIIPTLTYFHKSLSNMQAPLDLDEEIYPTAQKEAMHQLQKAMDDYIANESKGEAICQINRKPSTAIANYAQEENYDLIVMASKGHHKSNLMRGSTTNKVVRHSSVPVFTVDEGLNAEGLKEIMIPTDGSMLSFTALPMGITLASIYGADITFYHVQEMYGSPLDSESRDPQKTDKQNIYEALMRRLDEFLNVEGLDNIQIARGSEQFRDQFVVSDNASSHRIDIYTAVDRGVSAHLGIEDYAAEHADVVVMATHGHSGFAHLLLGSTTEKVAQSLSTPVVTVKPKVGKFTEK
ncbi:universal stress protein [Fodinibius sp. Rm-B-1B1-1]|uniref:universal stress protein n=1 Tax=Fodinibius alkaliphilus TaxID=3140241 RepID=UPI003159B6AA